MKKRMEKETTQRRDILNRVPRIVLGVLLILIGILCFTNAEPFSRFLKWLSVYIFGVLFFVLGFALMGIGAYLLIVPREKGKYKIPWLDVASAIVAFFSLSVLISSSDAFKDIQTSSFTSTYSYLMAQSSPSGFFVELPERISLVGGGFLPTLFVSFGNSMGMGLVGTRSIFWIILVLSIIVILRHPALALSKVIVRIREEQARSKFEAPVIERNEDTKKADSTNQDNNSINNGNNSKNNSSQETVTKGSPFVSHAYDYEPTSEGYAPQNGAKESVVKDASPVSSFEASKVEDTFQSQKVEDVGPIFGKVETSDKVVETKTQEDSYSPEVKADEVISQKNESSVATSSMKKDTNSIVSQLDDIPVEEVKKSEPKVEDVDFGQGTVQGVKEVKEEPKVEEVSFKPVQKEQEDIQPKPTVSEVTLPHVEETPKIETLKQETSFEQVTPKTSPSYQPQTANFANPKIEEEIKEVKLPPKVINVDGFTSLQTDEEIEADRKKAEENMSNKKPVEEKQSSFALPKMEPTVEKPAPIHEEEEIAPKPVEKVVPVQPIIYTSSKKYVLPDDSLLKDYDNTKALEEIQKKAMDIGYQINKFFKDFGIKAHSENYNIGASVTCFHIHLEPGVKMASIDNVLPNLSVTLNGNSSVRFLKVIPGKNFSGIEVGNSVTMTVPFKQCYDYLMSIDPKCQKKLLIPLGLDVFGNIRVTQLDKLPHLLVAGSTGSGKSVFVHSVILSIIMRTYPNEVKFMLIDPKKVEFARYADMPHLFCPIITESEQAEVALNKMVVEMDRRFDLFKKSGVVNFGEYADYCKSHSSAEKIPLIVIIIDEFADLMSTACDGSAAVNVGRLAAKARAAGIHLIVATQRPSTNVISGDIKNNIPARIGLLVSSSTDSRVILDETGAENLVGRGDLLAKIPGSKETLRCQSPYVSDSEVKAVLDYLKARAKPVYNPEFVALDAEPAADDYSGAAGASNIYERLKNDPMYQKAKEIVAENHKASANFLCKAMNVSYLKASNYLDAMDSEGFTKKFANGRRVLASDLETTED